MKWTRPKVDKFKSDRTYRSWKSFYDLFRTEEVNLNYNLRNSSLRCYLRSIFLTSRKSYTERCQAWNDMIRNKIKDIDSRLFVSLAFLVSELWNLRFCNWLTLNKCLLGSANDHWIFVTLINASIEIAKQQVLIVTSDQQLI